MSDNKFILQLKGTQTPKSVVEIKNDKLVAPFVNVPGSSDVVGSIIPDKDSSVVVAKGADVWKLNGGSLVPATNLTGDGADFTGEYAVSGSGLWVNATHTFSDTKIFTPNTKWVLQLCGKNLNAGNGDTIDFSFIVKIGSTNIMTKTVTVSEQANFFCKRFVLDFSESIQTAIKAEKNTSLIVQLLCADATASATIYNGMTTLTTLQRRVDGEVVASESHTFEDLEVEIAEIQDDIADINGKIIVRSATIPTASADLVGKVYQYAGATNGVYTHNYIYECQEIETNSYGWVRVDVQPNHEAQILALQADVSDIEALIPAQATPQNQLGDKAFINSSIATNTANFIGTFNSVAELEAYTGTVTNNDYAFVIGTDSAGNTTYNRYKYNANTQQWAYEYTLNNSSFTAQQWATINSGATASDVALARSAVQPSGVGNGTITINQGGATKGTFTTNQGGNTTIELDAGSDGSYHPDLFDVKWSDHICNDVQWLRGDTFSWQDGGVYEQAYNHLLYDITHIQRTPVYMWRRTVGGTDYYVFTLSATPQVDDTAYIRKNDGTNLFYEPDQAITAVPDSTHITCGGYTYTYDDLVIDGIVAQKETVAGTDVIYYVSTDGHKICWDDQESNVAAIYTATGVAWYYILDTANQRFKLPRSSHNKYTTELGVIGTGKTLGFTDGTNNYGLEVTGNNPNNYLFRTGDYGKTVGQNGGDGSTGTSAVVYGITTDPTKSGIKTTTIAQDTDQYKYLYFYVGSFTQTALENTAGLNAELFNSKADLNLANVLSNIDFVIESQLPTAANNYTWFRKYKSGWVEQGGTLQSNANSLTFPVEMADTNYQWDANMSPQDFGNFRKFAATRTITGLTGLSNLFGTSTAHNSEAVWETGTFWWVWGVAAS